MIDPQPTLIATGTLVALAYGKNYSPISRVAALQNSLREATNMNDDTRALKSKLPAQVHKDAEDHERALFSAKVNVAYVQGQLEDEGIFRKYVNPIYSCERNGEKLELRKLEKDVLGYKKDVINTSMRAREAQELVEQATPEQQSMPPPANPFTQNARRSWDEPDLENGRRDAEMENLNRGGF